MTADEIPLAASGCDTCGRAVRGGWAFRPDDVRCSLCGDRVYHVDFDEFVPNAGPQGELWVYLPADPEDSDYGRVSLRARGRRGGKPHSGIELPLYVDWSESRLRFAVPRFGRMEFALDSVKAANPPRVANVNLLPVGLRQPSRLALGPLGAPGELILSGPAGPEVVAARLMARPRRWLRLTRPGAPNLERLIVYYTPVRHPKHGDCAQAAIDLELVADEAPVSVRAIALTRKSENVIAATVLKGSDLLGQVVEPGKPRRFQLRVYARAGVGATSEWVMLGFTLNCGPSAVIEVRFALRPAPVLAFSPEPRREEVRLGGTKSVTVFVSAPDGDGDAPTVSAALALPTDAPPWVVFQPRPPDTFDVPKGGERAIHLEMRSAGLPRVAFDGKELQAFLLLTDQAGKVWEHPLRAVFRRMPRLDVPLALDWGTTNTCAAWVDGLTRPASVGFEADGLSDRRSEAIPSDLYFEDVADRVAPVFHLGTAAQFMANADNRWEALVVSLKRQFVRGGTAHVTDRKGVSQTYRVDYLTRLVLGRLVLMAEQGMGKEVRSFGITFPTKWPAAVRRRLAAVLDGVRADLQSVYGDGVAVNLLPPRIDEANAVALNLLDELHRGGRLEDRAEFVVVSYDFGGGTVDTSILRVVVDPDADPVLRTEYLGIGGLGEFGGDEVTRAILFLLRDRAVKWLDTPSKPGEDPGRHTLPLLASGQAPPRDVSDPAQWYRDGRKNWEVLWGVAEKIKFALCDPGWDASSNEPVRYYLDQRLTMIQCHQAGDPAVTQDLAAMAGGRAGYPDRFFQAVRFGLDELYSCTLPSPDGATRASIRQRIEDLAQELKFQCDLAGVARPDYVVLAGGGCRLPLVQESLTLALGVSAAGLIYDPEYAKQRVAHGKAWYAFNRTALSMDAGLAASVDVLHRPISVAAPPLSRQPFRVVARTGARADAPEVWHPFPLPRYLVVRDEGGRRVVLRTVGWRDGERRMVELGAFDLDRPAAGQPGDPPSEAAPLPEDAWSAEGAPDAHLRLRRDPPGSLAGALRIDLCVTAGGRRYGPYPFVPRAPTADQFHDELQGPGFGG